MPESLAQGIPVPSGRGGCQTAQLLREQRWEEIDWEHLIEEVEDLGKSECSTTLCQCLSCARVGQLVW
ncbi:MAG: DUF29 family protein [Thermosynechococcaceae cyanobacterium]